MARKRKQYTPEEKRAYYAKLHQEWREAKAAAQGNGEVEAIFKHLQKMNIPYLSLVNIQLVLMQAQALGFEGMPYVDFKTYEHWQKSGFQVRRGETSQVHTITWIGQDANEDDEDSESYRFPKLTSLFHSSQVDPIIVE